MWGIRRCDGSATTFVARLTFIRVGPCSAIVNAPQRGSPVKRIGALIIGDEILSGKRADAHLSHVIAALSARGLVLGWARYEGDDRARLTAVLRETFASGDLVFAFGGVGATPDDHTRHAAAAALGVPLVRHPEALAEIEARFGKEAWPHRVLMAEFPAGSAIIPNPVNRIASFSIHDHHFFPGFPQMAWPMLDWVLATHYPTLVCAAVRRAGDRRIWRRRKPAPSRDGRQRRALSAAEALQPADFHAATVGEESSSGCVAILRFSMPPSPSGRGCRGGRLSLGADRSQCRPGWRAGVDEGHCARAACAFPLLADRRVLTLVAAPLLTAFAFWLVAAFAFGVPLTIALGGVIARVLASLGVSGDPGAFATAGGASRHSC